MRHAFAHLGILVLAALAVWNGRCVTSCAADSLVPPCHRQKTQHSPQAANCTLQMVAERPGLAPDALPAAVPIAMVPGDLALLHGKRDFVPATGAVNEPILRLRI